MKYIELRKIFNDRPFFTKQDILLRDPNFSNGRIMDWQRKGYITRIANNFYTWVDHAHSPHEKMFMANNLYKPSYISTKSALRLYNFIPEAVYTIFSVTTRKTKRVESPIGNFEYQTIKPGLLFGHTFYNFQNITVLLAEPEKALLDFWYLNPAVDSREALEGLRLNAEEMRGRLNPEKLKKYTDNFDNKRLTKVSKILQKQIWSW